MSSSDRHSLVRPAADSGTSLSQRVTRLMQRIGLRFEDADDEQRFVDTFVRGSLLWTQAAMVLGALTYAGYTFWDWVLYPEVVPITLAIRGGTAVVVLLPLTALIAFARSWTETILLLYCVIPGCVLPFVYLVLPSGFTFASAGMIIVILFVSTMLPLRVGTLLVFCVTTWLAFAFVEWIAPSLPTGLGFINHFLIGNAYLLALYAVGAREYRARRQFETTEALRRETARSEASLQALRAAQAHLVQAEKLASLGQLFAGFGHEVSTPIGLALTTSTALQGDVQRAVSDGEQRTGPPLRSRSRRRPARTRPAADVAEPSSRLRNDPHLQAGGGRSRQRATGNLRAATLAGADVRQAEAATIAARPRHRDHCAVRHRAAQLSGRARPGDEHLGVQRRRPRLSG
ncbi:hypothetical protein [Rhodopseudomonas sp. B29]|uniref:hypothetical protein n=1 Tax=Rhodopseudomonas sp. B29 TaxID=95607 RepID=UPI00034AB2E6|nr:hypothetical protein [Rhodopseudomonas sp. B29]